jgi:hypothetical protein
MPEARVTRGAAKGTAKGAAKGTAKGTAKVAPGRRDIIRGEHLAWKIRIPDHAGREQSSAFRAAKKLGHKIVLIVDERLPKQPVGGCY